MENKDKLKELREKLKLSQVKFAEKFSVPVRTIQDWESGRREMRNYIIEMMYRIVELESK
nr:MAG TPA: regulatory protein [Caudoviricetes sp.]